MRRKQFMTLCMVLAVVGAVGFPTLTVDAAGLTQAVNAGVVNYGKLSKVERNVIKGFFDYQYYKDNNPEVVEAIGDDYNKLFEHFCKCGIFEGRTCNPNFDPSAYASAYSQLKDKFGTDIVKYYLHYAAFGQSEGRNLTTVEACANAGITVEGLVGSDVRISPAVYKLAMKMGTTDYKTVQTALERAASSSSSSSSSGSSSSSTTIQTNDGTYVIVEDGGDADAYAKAAGLKKVGKLALDGDSYVSLSIYIISGIKGYAAVDDSYFDEHEYIDVTRAPLYQTSDYVAREIVDYDDDEHCVAEITLDFSAPSSSNTDLTGKPSYVYEIETTTLESGNWLSADVTYYDYYSNYNINTSETATDYEHTREVIDGYYTNSDGSEKYVFDDYGEVYEWLDDYNRTSDVYYKPVYTSYHGVDVYGDASTVYNVGIELTENEDGSLGCITVGISNDENEFGYVSVNDITSDKYENSSEDEDSDSDQQNDSSDESENEDE